MREERREVKVETIVHRREKMTEKMAERIRGSCVLTRESKVCGGKIS